MPYYLESLYGAMLVQLRECAMDWDGWVHKYSGPVLSRLWTKVYVVLGHCRIPLVVVSALTRSSISRFIPKI